MQPARLPRSPDPSERESPPTDDDTLLPPLHSTGGSPAPDWRPTMDRIDFGGAVMALLTGFVLSAGLTAFVVSAGGYQPTDLLPPRPALMTAPGAPGAAIAAPPIAVQALLMR